MFVQQQILKVYAKLHTEELSNPGLSTTDLRHFWLEIRWPAFVFFFQIEALYIISPLKEDINKTSTIVIIHSVSSQHEGVPGLHKSF